jgi:hypothetical protein
MGIKENFYFFGKKSSVLYLFCPICAPRVLRVRYECPTRVLCVSYVSTPLPKTQPQVITLRAEENYEGSSVQSISVTTFKLVREG